MLAGGGRRRESSRAALEWGRGTEGEWSWPSQTAGTRHGRQGAAPGVLAAAMAGTSRGGERGMCGWEAGVARVVQWGGSAKGDAGATAGQWPEWPRAAAGGG